MRQPWNVFVYLYRTINTGNQYLLLKRKDDGIWQGAAGGGEEGETIYDAAIREMFEETGASGIKLIKLDTISYMEKILFADYEKWDNDVLVVPMYYFAAEYNGDIKISEEHTKYDWLNYDEAMEKLYWHDNKTALWELSTRLNNT